MSEEPNEFFSLTLLVPFLQEVKNLFYRFSFVFLCQRLKSANKKIFFHEQSLISLCYKNTNRFLGTLPRNEKKTERE